MRSDEGRAAESGVGEVAISRPPMLAELSETLPQGDDWTFERKLDGLRCIAVRNGDDVQLWSRNHLSFNNRFPDVIEALRSIPVTNFVVDGEVVAYDAGRTSFSLLQRRVSGSAPVYALFDLLHLLGRDTTIIPLSDRRELLAKTFGSLDPSVGVLQLMSQEQGDASSLLARACAEGWEGIIAKKAKGLYTSGRSRDWRKLKCSASQELVIGGWTEPRGTRTGFGALLVGYYEGEDLRYAGKVGTGFNTTLLKSLHAQLVERELDISPFTDQVREKGAHWARPQLVANIAFTEWTRGGKLRHPRFEGLRPDKSASAVVRESI